MGDPVTALAVSAISSGVSAYGKVQAGKAQSRAYKAQAAAAAQEARVNAMRVREVSADYFERLQSDLSAMASMTAGKNLSGDTASTFALNAGFTDETLRAKARAELEPSVGALNALNSRRAALMAGKAAQTAGWLNAAGDIISAGTSLYKIGTR